MTTGEIVFGVIGLVVGFLLGAVTLYYTRRGTVASERSASATERSAAAAEALVPPVSPSVSWTLTRRKGILYLLRNTGTEQATEVTVTLLPAEAEGFLRYPPPDSIGAGDAHEIGVLNGPATSLQVECAQTPVPAILPLE